LAVVLVAAAMLKDQQAAQQALVAAVKDEISSDRRTVTQARTDWCFA